MLITYAPLPERRKVRKLKMGTCSRPDKVKLTIGLLFTDIKEYRAVKSNLASVFGEIDFESEILDFHHTSYYTEEMGHGITRVFLSFRRLFDLENICVVKIKTNRIEEKHSKAGKRKVNIDPGYLNLAKLVLFSTKDYTHRIYLGKRIYAEVTLFYKDDSFNPWPWTYPDYKSPEYMKIFGSIRQLYKEQTTK